MSPELRRVEKIADNLLVISGRLSSETSTSTPLDVSLANLGLIAEGRRREIKPRETQHPRGRKSGK